MAKSLLMKAFILLTGIAVIGLALIVTGGITGFAIIEACPQPSWVYLNNISLSEADDSIIQRVENYFDTKVNHVKVFNKDKEYYLVEFIQGATIRECVTDLEVTCGCQENSYS
jgi:hypothetical protein